MYKHSKIITLLIAIFVLGSVFFGCTPADKEDADVPNNQEPTKEAATEQKEESEQEPEEVSNEPVKVVFYINNGFNADTASNPDALEEVHEWFLQEINVDFEYIIPPVEKADEKLNLILASDQQCDAFWGSWQQYSGQEMIQPITDIYNEADYPGIAKEFGPYMSVMTDGNGELWGLPRQFDTAPYPFIYRIDYADAVGVTSAPTTIEELNTLLYAFADKDVAGNGETIPLITTVLTRLHPACLRDIQKAATLFGMTKQPAKSSLQFRSPDIKIL